MTTITDINGKEVTVDCIACAIQKQEVELPMGVLAENDSFQLEQDFEVPVPGFLVLVSKRHILGVDEFTEQEQSDFISLLTRARRALKEGADVERAYLVLEEDTENSHFHLWIVPVYDWMVQKFGRGISNVKEMMKYARSEMKTSQNLAEVKRVSEMVRDALKS